jgi:hypothetical protein
MAVTLRANSELVAVAWIESIPGFPPGIAGTQLPADTTTWASTGFITVSVVGGSPDVDTPIRKPVMQIDCWACTPGSNLPPWFQAADLAEQVRLATYDEVAFGRELRPTINGITYPTAKAMTAYVLTEPRRIYDDVADYSRYSLTISLQWIQLDR